MSTEVPRHYLSIPLKASKHSKLVVCRISGTPDSLPLTITATDGQSPFSAKLSKKEIRDAKGKSFDGTDDEWQNTVVDALFGIGKADIRLVAQMTKARDKIMVHFQRDEEDEDLIVRIGMIEIEEDSEADVDLMDWLAESVNATVIAQAKVRRLEQEANSEHGMIEKLQKQLDTLVKAKEDYETELLIKFNMLLNEKKAKIRQLTNNGPVPEARIPSPSASPEPEEKPKRGTKAVKAKPPAKKKAAPKSKAAPAKSTREKRKRSPSPEPPHEEEDEQMLDAQEEEDEGSVTADEDSVQGDDERDADAERTFGLRTYEGDVTEDEDS